jgi:sugar lactone lactonase YvrE
MSARWMAAPIVLLLVAQGAPVRPAAMQADTAARDVLPRSFTAVHTGIGRPSAVTADARGNVYVAAPELSRVFRIDAAGRMTVVAGGAPRIGPFDPQSFPNGDGGSAAESSLGAPVALAVDGFGNVYIADDGDRAIRRIDGRTGIITTFLRSPTPSPGLPAAGGSRRPPGDPTRRADPVEGPLRPWGLAVDTAGNLYVADRATHTVFRIPSGSGPIEKIAGTGIPGYVGDGGPALKARLSSPEGVAVDSAGNAFVADRGNHCVRRVDARTGVITTIMGSGFAGNSGDGGKGPAAQLHDPAAIAVNSGGDVFIADLGNARVRRVAKSTGLVSTVAGLAQVDCASIATAGDGALLVVDVGHATVLRRSRTGVVTTIAGDGTMGATGDGGPATSAYLSGPAALARDGAGNLYVADAKAHRVRRIDVRSGLISTVAGNGRPGFSGDGGPAVEASLSEPQGVAFDRDGRLLIADMLNHRVRRLGADGTIATIAGRGDDGAAEEGAPALKARLGRPTAIAVDAHGDLIVLQSVYGMISRIDAEGTLHTILGRRLGEPLREGAPSTSAYVGFIGAIALGRRGDILFANEQQRVWSLDVATRVVNVVAGRGIGPPAGAQDEARGVSLARVQAMAVDAAGNLYLCEQPPLVRRVDAATRHVVTLAAGTVRERLNPVGLVVGDADTLYIADAFGFVRRIGPDGRLDVIAGGGPGF